MNIVEVDPSYFVDSDRLDIICRYLYVKSKNENTNHLHYKEIYKECIQSQTQGIDFDLLIESFKTKGYDKEYPIHSNSAKTINGGAHRIACSLYYNQKIPTVIAKDTQPKIRLLNRKWFETEGFSEQVILEWEATLDKLSGSR